MVKKIVFQNSNFLWLDIINPTEADLKKMAAEYALPSNLVEDCLDSQHLPKYEKFNNLNFLILRSYDNESEIKADTIQRLTRKIAIFVTDKFLISIHRVDLKFYDDLRKKWESSGLSPEFNRQELIIDFISNVIYTYELPVNHGFNQLEEFEMGVFGSKEVKPFKLNKGYYLKRKSSVFKRILKLTHEILLKLETPLGMSPSQYQNIREEIENLLFYADELSESINSLMNLHISLSSQKTNEASHKTNEVVRILTIFSVFLLPLNLITGIYGMNFEFMPELKAHWGYPMTLFSMFVVSLSIYFWFRTKGWMK